MECPLEIVDMILGFANWNDVKNLLLVSKGWCNIVRTLNVRRNISSDEIETVPKYFVEKYFEKMICTFPKCLENVENLIYLVGYFPNLLNSWQKFWNTACCTLFTDPVCFQSLVESLPTDNVQVEYVDINYICLEIVKNFYDDSSKRYITNLKTNIAYLVNTFPKSIRSIFTGTDRDHCSFPQVSDEVYFSVMFMCCSLTEIVTYLYRNKIYIVWSEILDVDVNKDVGPQSKIDVINFANTVVEMKNKSICDRVKFWKIGRVWDLFFQGKDNIERIYRYLSKLDPTTLTQFFDILNEGGSWYESIMLRYFPFHRYDSSLAQRFVTEQILKTNLRRSMYLMINPRLCNIGTNFMKHLLVGYVFKNLIPEDRVNQIYKILGLEKQQKLYDRIQDIPYDDQGKQQSVLLKFIMMWDQWYKEKKFWKKLYDLVVSEKLPSYIVERFRLYQPF